MSNLDKVKPKIEVELGGKKRFLVFDFWAISLIEKETKKNFLTGDLLKEPSATDIIALVWAGLQKDEPKLAMEEVGRMIDFSNLPKVTEAIQKAFLAASPVEESVKKTPESEDEQP